MSVTAHPTTAPRATTRWVADVEVDSAPWSVRDLARMLFFSGCGVVGAFVCWSVGSRKLTYSDQVPWLVGSIASAGLVALAFVYWLVAGFRQVRLAERASVDLLLPLSASGRGLSPLEDDPYHPAHDPAHRSENLVTAAGMHRVHRASCQLVQGKAGVRAVAAEDIARESLEPCGVCRP